MDLIGKFSSSVKEKMEKYLASSTFELELYNATSNSNSNQASTKGMYLIAEKSYNYECLLTIIARIRQRLISDQRKKWKRINKTMHLIEFLLKNGSFQFVIVFIEKFSHLVKPYTNYSYSEDGIDRGYAIRECSRRILELSKDRKKLKEERTDSVKLKKRIQGEGKGKKRTGTSSGKRYVIDEDAFYNQKGDDNGKEGSETGTKKKTKEYDPDNRKPNLARRLGLDEDATEKTKEEIEKEKNRKKTKEELEREKEIDEVRQIIEGDAGFNKYIKEVDLLGMDMEESQTSVSKSSPKKGGDDMDLLGMEMDSSPQQGQSGSGFGNQQGQFGNSQPTLGQEAKITFDKSKQTDEDNEFGDFQDAESKPKTGGFSNQFKQDELNLLDLDNMGPGPSN